MPVDGSIVVVRGLCDRAAMTAGAIHVRDSVDRHAYLKILLRRPLLAQRLYPIVTRQPRANADSFASWAWAA
jgi:hypothetical protein